MATELRLKLKLKYATVQGALALGSLTDVNLSAIQDGQMLMYSGGSWFNFTPDYMPGTLAFNDQRGNGPYTLQASDANKLVIVDDALTVPDALPTGFQCTVVNAGAPPVALTIDAGLPNVLGAPATSISGNAPISVAIIDADTVAIFGETEV